MHLLTERENTDDTNMDTKLMGPPKKEHTMKKILAALLVTVGTSMVAQAGFLVEPEVGAQIGSAFNYQYGTTAYNYTEASYPVGLRLAYKANNGFWVGVHADYYMSGTLTHQNTAAGADDTFTRTVGSAEIGYEGARGFRVFAGYDFTNNITNTPSTTTSNTADFTALGGTGAYAGIGWRFHSHIAINVLYDAPTYTTVTPNVASNATTFTSSTYNTFSDSIVNVTVSFPFGFGGH
jgi:hypothetical protein